MDNSKPNLPESEPTPEPPTQADTQPASEPELYTYLNERIRKVLDRAKILFISTKDRYREAPRLQKAAYQRKFLPAFWTVACIFSLVVNVILIAILISVGHNFFQLKALVSDGLVIPASNSLEMMDKAHIITTVPVEKTLQVQDSLPVVFELAIDQNSQLTLAQDTRINGAYIYLNNTAVTTDLTLPAKTPLQANINVTVPVSTTVPVSLTIPITLQVPVDIAVDQTDLHQSIVGLQGALEPYKTVMGSTFNSPKDFSMCNFWMTGWLCDVVFGK